SLRLFVPVDHSMSMRPFRVCMILLAGLVLACAPISGCGFSRWRVPAAKPGLPSNHTVALDQLVIVSNFELPTQHRLLQEINAQRVDLSNELNLPVSDEAIRVYLFKDDEEYH